MAGSVIVPLYIYPSMGAWNPIFDMYEPMLFRMKSSEIWI
jgi:hypothetical protein